MAKSLTNRSRRAQIYNLPHQSYCSDGTCRCVGVKQHAIVRDNRSGAVGVAVREKRLGASIHFSAGESKASLPDTITKCPEIAGALARRELIEPKPATKTTEPKRPVEAKKPVSETAVGPK